MERILCLDEFEIKDITDAMIIKRLFLELIKNKVFVFITSSIQPANLYKYGLQRQSFLPFINYINNKFEVIYLENNHDYRFDKLRELNNRFIYSINPKNNLKIKNTISRLANDKTVSDTIELFKHQILFNKHTKAL